MPNLTTVNITAGVPTFGTGTVSTVDALMALVGEVQASPTSNTLLDRIKQILTGVVLAAGSNLIGKVGLDQTTHGATNAVAVMGTPGTYSTETNATITTGGTAQNAVASNASRTKLKFQNTSTGDMRVKVSGAASGSAGLWLPPGSFYEWPPHDIPTGALSVWGATTGQSYYVAEG